MGGDARRQTKPVPLQNKIEEKKTTPATFDEKPAMSLKEALEKALREQNPDLHDEKKGDASEKNNHKSDQGTKKNTTDQVVVEEARKIREVSEDVLRKLLDEE
jgi:hypothetical protein